MSLVDIKMAEFNMMGLEPNIENAVILAIYDIVKSFKFMQMTDATLETITSAIIEECGSYISDLTLKPIACESTIEVMFKMDGRTIMRQVFLTRNVETKKRSFSEDE